MQKTPMVSAAVFRAESPVAGRLGEMNMKKRKPVICPTCRQSMNEPPRRGLNGRYCPLCGQGMSWRKVRPRRGPLSATWLFCEAKEET